MTIACLRPWIPISYVIILRLHARHVVLAGRRAAVARTIYSRACVWCRAAALAALVITSFCPEEVGHARNVE